MARRAPKLMTRRRLLGSAAAAPVAAPLDPRGVRARGRTRAPVPTVSGAGATRTVCSITRCPRNVCPRFSRQSA